MRFFLTLAALLYLSAAFFQDWFLRPTCRCTVLETGTPPPRAGDALKATLKQHVYSLVALNASPTTYLETQWKNIGYETPGAFAEPGALGPIARWVEKSGTKNNAEILVVTASLGDPKRFQGADGYASGTAALIELARWIYSTPLDRKVRLVALSQTDDDRDATSRFGAELMRGREKVNAMVSLGSLAYFNNAPLSQHFPLPQKWLYPSVGNFIEVLGFLKDERSRGLVNVATQLFSEGSVVPPRCHKSWNTLRGSYLPETVQFYRAGLPAIQISDSGAYRNPYLNSPLDTPDRLDYERLAETLLGIKKVVEGLANDPGPSTSPHIS